MQEITVAIERAQSLLSLEERIWLRLHARSPRRIRMYENLSGDATIDGFLVTDHTGVDDFGYWIVYLPSERTFGYEVTLENGRELFVGRVGTLVEAVQNL